MQIIAKESVKDEKYLKLSLIVRGTLLIAGIIIVIVAIRFISDTASIFGQGTISPKFILGFFGFQLIGGPLFGTKLEDKLEFWYELSTVLVSIALVVFALTHLDDGFSLILLVGGFVIVVFTAVRKYL